jgi:hypothetical protein
LKYQWNRRFTVEELLEVNPMRNVCNKIAAGLILLICFSTSAHATTYTAASCSASDVQSAINKATDGDTVIVPSSSCTWSSQVTINKGITLNGQGATVTFGSSGGLTMASTAAASAAVTAFNFRNGFTNGGYPFEINLSSSAAPPHVYNNTFTDTSSGAPITFLATVGLGPALIDHNTFTVSAGADEIIHLLGLGAGNAKWVDSVTPGSSMMVVMENNVFTENNTTYAAQAEEAYYGAEFTFRYNTVNNGGNDMHGGDGGRWAEIYQNTYTKKNNSQIRGGSALYYNNHSSGSGAFGFTWGPDPGSSDISSGTRPVPKQVGRGINTTTYSPGYAWGNDASIQDSISAEQGQSLTLIGSSINACGGYGCDVVVTASMPTLQRCESTSDGSASCPLAYTYTPLVYPHPLDSCPTNVVGTSSQCSNSAPPAPAPPTSLIITSIQ